MYKNPGIKITQVLIMDNKLMYKNPGIKITQILIMDNKLVYKNPAIKQHKFLSYKNPPIKQHKFLSCTKIPGINFFYYHGWKTHLQKSWNKTTQVLIVDNELMYKNPTKKQH